MVRGWQYFVKVQNVDVYLKNPHLEVWAWLIANCERHRIKPGWQSLSSNHLIILSDRRGHALSQTTPTDWYHGGDERL